MRVIAAAPAARQAWYAGDTIWEGRIPGESPGRRTLLQLHSVQQLIIEPSASVVLEQNALISRADRDLAERVYGHVSLHGLPDPVPRL